MALSYVNSAKFPTSFPGSSNNIATVTIAKPTNTASGDTLVAFIITVSGAAMTTVPSGWTLYDSVDNGSNMKLWVYWKQAGGSEPASYAWTDDSGGIGPMCGLVSAWRGCVASNPLGEGNSATTTTADPVTTPSVVTTWPATYALHFACTRTTNVASQGTYTNGAGQTERMNPGNRGGSTQYSGELSSATTVAPTTNAGSQSGVSFDYSGTATNGIQYQLALNVDVPATSAPATVAGAAITAYDAGTAVSTTSAFAAATVAAYDATVQTGVATSATAAGATVTAYDAAGWVIHPVNVGVQAFDASVAITTNADYAAASVAVGGAVGYFGAPESRRWRIGPENRSWAIQPESRVWKIPPKD